MTEDHEPEYDALVAASRRNLRVRRAAAMTLLWGIRGDDTGRSIGIDAARADSALASLPEIMHAVITHHLASLPSARVVYLAAVAATEHDQPSPDDTTPPDILAEVRINRLILLCRTVVEGEGLRRLEEGIENELHAYSMVTGP